MSTRRPPGPSCVTCNAASPRPGCCLAPPCAPTHLHAQASSRCRAPPRYAIRPQDIHVALHGGMGPMLVFMAAPNNRVEKAMRWWERCRRHPAPSCPGFGGGRRDHHDVRDSLFDVGDGGSWRSPPSCSRRTWKRRGFGTSWGPRIPPPPPPPPPLAFCRHDDPHVHAHAGSGAALHALLTAIPRSLPKVRGLLGDMRRPLG